MDEAERRLRAQHVDARERAAAASEAAALVQAGERRRLARVGVLAQDRDGLRERSSPPVGAARGEPRRRARRPVPRARGGGARSPRSGPGRRRRSRARAHARAADCRPSLPGRRRRRHRSASGDRVVAQQPGGRLGAQRSRPDHAGQRVGDDLAEQARILSRLLAAAARRRRRGRVPPSAAAGRPTSAARARRTSAGRRPRAGAAGAPRGSRSASRDRAASPVTSPPAGPADYLSRVEERRRRAPQRPSSSSAPLLCAAARRATARRVVAPPRRRTSARARSRVRPAPATRPPGRVLFASAIRAVLPIPGGPSIASSRVPSVTAAIRSAIAASSLSRSSRSFRTKSACPRVRMASPGPVSRAPSPESLRAERARGRALRVGHRRWPDQNTVVRISVGPRGGARLARAPCGGGASHQMHRRSIPDDSQIQGAPSYERQDPNARDPHR